MGIEDKKFTEGWTHVALQLEEDEDVIDRLTRLMWLRQAFGHPATWDDGVDQPGVWIRYRHLYWFKNERDATLFMLRWT